MLTLRLALVIWLTLSAPFVAAAEGWTSLRPTDDAEVVDTTDAEPTSGNVGVFYRSEGNPNLMLTCTETEGLRVSFGLEDIDFRTAALTATSRFRRVRVKLLIDGEETTGIQSVYLPSLKVLDPQREVPARKVFNSVVRQVPIELSMPGKGKFTYTLPAVDDAFRDFANSCSVTSR